ncbi:CHASE2 domain-containing protein [Leptolyngbya sp. AN02str]|uniref:CHASE2 domain-containing protein n=1 Tax=Leptolyngbya sp. AN02str TaxID=3423363 RepID=UPI003D310764
MSKFVVLKIGEGSFDAGFPVMLQIAEESEGAHASLALQPFAEMMGKLPPDPTLPQLFDHWQSSYRRLGMRSRLSAPTVQETNVSLTGDCRTAAQHLGDRLNQWLLSETFRPLRELWLEKLHPTETIRVLVQTNDVQLQRLPWHLWDVMERYPQAELALSTSVYERIVQPPSQTQRVRVLAILGNSEGIDTQADRRLLEALPQAEVQFLVEPQRQSLTDHLWEQPWDILFFAGHSTTTADGDTGHIAINPSDRLSMSELRYGLRKALHQGLKLAIFNSCDGLGLARELADLNIPQLIVMREPVPDRVAQVFLNYFLTRFSTGESLYLSVREARERLQALEDEYLCATWLPVIYQNPSVKPPTWYSLAGISIPVPQPTADAVVSPPKRDRASLWKVALSSLLAAGLMIGVRAVGGFQAAELATLNYLMKLRPSDRPDYRFLLITIDEAERQTYGTVHQGFTLSISDGYLKQLLDTLQAAQPRVIGLDLYRDLPVEPGQTALLQHYQNTDQLIGVCKAADEGVDSIAPPPTMPTNRVGFSDFVVDQDGVLRRQLVSMRVTRQDPNAPCVVPYAFAAQVAFRYLANEGIRPQLTELTVNAKATDAIAFNEVVLPPVLSWMGPYQQFDDRGYQLLLNYRNHREPFSQASLTDVLTGAVNPDVIRDRIVLIGVTANSSNDYWQTPVSHAPMPGVVVQAHMTSQLISATLDQRPLLWMWPFGIDALWITGWSLVGGGLVWWLAVDHRANVRWRVVAIAIGAGVAVFACGVLFHKGGWVPVLPTLAGLTLAGTLVAVHQTLHTSVKP